MRFRLTYSGELRSTQPDRRHHPPLSAHKHAIRKEFHKQLKFFWQTNWFLSNCRVYPNDYGCDRAPASYFGFDYPADEKISRVDAVAFNHRQNGYEFVPLVRKNWKLECKLEILFLRHDPPGGIIHAGDLDNRVKSLIDTLRIPSQAELGEDTIPGDDHRPFFCLLEDDKLVTALSVETDTLMKPPEGKMDPNKAYVELVITVSIRPFNISQFNLNFA